MNRLPNMTRLRTGQILIIMALAFVTLYSLVHLVLGIIHHNPRWITGGVLFPLVAAPLITITLAHCRTREEPDPEDPA